MTNSRRSAPGDGGGLILAWHRIARLAPDSHGLCVAPQAFHEQVSLLRERCRVLPLPELLEAARAGLLAPDSVALTFDDGYLDSLSTAAPILDGLPATFFVNSERLDSPHEAWHDELERLVPDPTRHGELHARLMPLGHTDRHALLDGLRKASGLLHPPREERRLLLAEEVLELSRRPGCEIGSHSVHHLFLPAHAPQVQRDEVALARDALRSLLDRPVESFAYPFGGHDHGSVAAVREAGHLVAVTVEPGRVTRASEALLLPRIEVRDLASIQDHLQP